MAATEHPNAAIARRAYDAFAKVDLDAIRESIAEDAVWHIPGRHQFSGEYKGRDEILGLLARIVTVSEGTLSLEVHDIVASDDHAVVLVRERAERAGKSLDMPEVHVYHVNAKGQGSEFWEFPFDQATYDAFWS